MPTFDQAVADYAKRRRQPLADARKLAESRIAWAVEEVLTGRDTMHAIDMLEPELRPFAHARLNERLAAGEGREGVVRISGLTGGRA